MNKFKITPKEGKSKHLNNQSNLNQKGKNHQGFVLWLGVGMAMEETASQQLTQDKEMHACSYEEIRQKPKQPVKPDKTPNIPLNLEEVDTPATVQFVSMTFRRSCPGI